MKITCIEFIGSKRGLSAADLKLLKSEPGSFFTGLSYRSLVLFKGPAGADRLATRWWAYERADKSKAYGKGAAWKKRIKTDWSDQTRGISEKGWIDDRSIHRDFEFYASDGGIDDKAVRAALRRFPKDAHIRTNECWWGDVDLSLKNVRTWNFDFPYEWGFEAQIKPQEYELAYRMYFDRLYC